MERKPAVSLRAFGLMWFGQLISLVGSGLSRFALGVWVYERTGSATQYTLILLFGFLPGLLTAPFAGALVDRWNRRWVMFGCNLTSALGVLTIVLLVRGDALQVWHVYLVAGISSVVNSFHWPAYIASTTQMVPKKHLGRANGLMQFGLAAAEGLSPVLAGALIALVGMAGVVLVDVVTFLFAASSLLLIRIPRPEVSGAGQKARGSLLREAAYGWTFIRERPGLLGLLFYFALINLVSSVCAALVIPLMLSFSTREVLSYVQGASGAGLLVGSIFMTVTGGPRPRVYGVLGFGLLFGVALAVVGLRPSPALIATGLFLTMFGVPFINGSSQAIWQVKVPADVQGRVFAVRRLIAQFTAPLGFFSAGPLADYVFRPLLLEGGPLAGSVGRVLGVGPGRGIGLIYVAMAVLPILASFWGYSKPHVRRVEEELPDAITA